MFFGDKDFATVLSNRVRPVVSQPGKEGVPDSPGRCAVLVADKSIAKL